MPRYGFSVEKTTLFRGTQQPFANIYYYEAPTVALTANVDQQTLLQQIVDKEKEFHSSAVNFVRGRVWNTGSGSQQGNQMRIDIALTGAGAVSDNSNMDRERAVLIRVPAGINSRGKPVYLRKWYHVCGSATTPGAFLAGQLANIQELNSTQRSYYAGKLNDIQELELLTNPVATLCAQSGRATTGEPECHAWLEHHQLGDQWR